MSAGTPRGRALARAHSDRTAGAWFGTFTTFLLLGAFLPAIVLRSSPGPGGATSTLIVQAALTVYFGTRLAALVRSGSPRPLTVVYWIFVYIAMGLAPLAQYATGLFSDPILDPSVNHQITTALAVLLGTVMVDVGSAMHRRSAGRNPRGRVPSRSPQRVREVSTRRLAFVSVLGLALGLLTMVKLGGPATFFTTRAGTAQALANAGLYGQQSSGLVSGSKVSSSLYITVGQTVPFVCLLSWSWLLLRSKRSGERLPAAFVVLWVLLVGENVILNNPLTNSRNWILTVLAGLFFGRPRLSNRSIRLLIPLAVVGGVLLFPYADYFRNPDHAQARQPVVVELATKDYDQTQMFSNIIAATSANGFSEGHQLLTDALFFVPRSVWHGKSVDTGTLIGQQIGSSSNLNLSSPLWGEFWQDGGCVAMILGMLLVGVAISAGDERFCASLDPRRRSVRAVDLLVPLFAGYLFILLRGPLLEAMGRSFVMAACVFGVTRALSRSRAADGVASTVAKEVLATTS